MKRGILFTLLPALLLTSCGVAGKNWAEVPKPAEPSDSIYTPDVREIKTLLTGDWECKYLWIEGSCYIAPTNPYRGYRLKIESNFECYWFIYDIYSGEQIDAIHTTYQGFDGKDEEPYEFTQYPNDGLEYSESTFIDGYFVIYASKYVEMMNGHTDVPYALYFRYMD